MRFNANKLAFGALLSCLIAVGAAMPAAAAPATALQAITWPWQKVEAESIEPGEYAAVMTVGQAQQLSPVILPEDATDKVSYASSDESIASVSSKGVVQAVSAGTVRIAAAAGSAVTYYDITVQTDTSTWVTEMDITLSANTILVGDNASVQIQILPTNATNTDQLTLTSSDEGVATVNSFGKITGIAPGTATITAACGNAAASANITVVSSESGTTAESITLNSSYVVLKPGATFALKASVSPSSASHSFTYKTKDSGVAAVSASGVITATGTGSTSVIVSNGTASALVTVIVNRSASASSENSAADEPSGTEPEEDVDAVVEAINSASGSEVTLQQSSVPVLTADMLTALHASGKTLVVTADNYTIRIDGTKLTDAQSELDTAIDFAAVDTGREFLLNGGNALPGTLEIEVSGELAEYKKLYLYNTLTKKWQYLNSYSDNVIKADTAGRYQLTNDTLTTMPVSWVFLIAAAVTGVAIAIVYIAFKKRYWFW